MGTDVLARRERFDFTAFLKKTTIAWSLLSVVACAPATPEDLEAEGVAYDDSADAGIDELEDKALTVSYQAESRTSQSGCVVSTNHAGYSGSGFVDYGGQGSWIEWNNVNVTQAGEYTLTFKYANGGASNRQLAVIVNGTNVGNVAFAPTGQWSTWKTTTTKALLRAGANTIRVLANTSAGGPNLDSMTLTGTAGGSCENQCSSACPCQEGQGDCDSNADCASGLVCPPDGAGSELCMKPTSGGSTGGGTSGGSGSVRDLEFVSFASLQRSRQRTRFDNVTANYVVYAESNGREGYNDIRKDQPGFVGMSGATLVGFGGGRDKYIALFKVTSKTVVIDLDQGQEDADGGAAHALFIKSARELAVVEARSVDPSVKAEDVPSPNGSSEIVVYAEDEGGKSDRDARFKPLAYKSYGSGDDLLYVFAKSLGDTPNGNGAIMRLKIR